MSEFQQSFTDTFLNSNFYFSFGISLLRLLAGFFISLVFSGVLVYLGVRFKAVEKVTGWFVAFMQPFPKIVLFPLILVFFGLNSFSKIFLIALGLFFTSYLILNSSVRSLFENRSFKIIKMFKPIKRSEFFYFKI